MAAPVIVSKPQPPARIVAKALGIASAGAGVPVLGDLLNLGAAPRRPVKALPVRLGSLAQSVHLSPHIDFFDDALARVVEALRRDEPRRKATLQAAADVLEAGKVAAGRQRALAELLLAIEEERHLVVVSEREHMVDPGVLKRFGVARADLTVAEVQARLATIAVQQAGELARIQGYVMRSPMHLRHERGLWLLDDAAPDDMRELVAAWANDPTVQRALERHAPKEYVPAPPLAPGSTVQDARESSGWHLARAARRRAMRESDRMERREHPGIEHPGHQVRRPDLREPNRPSTASRTLKPGEPGLGD